MRSIDRSGELGWTRWRAGIVFVCSGLLIAAVFFAMTPSSKETSLGSKARATSAATISATHTVTTAKSGYSGGHLVAADPKGGYWTVSWLGVVVPHGGALSFGSPELSGLRLVQPVVGMAATPDGEGYWLVASDGGIFAYGDAQFYGSTGAFHLNQPVVGMAATPDGEGYWLVASDGGIFTFGDASSMGRPAHSI